jgi:hypothetical protein
MAMVSACTSTATRQPDSTDPGIDLTVPGVAQPLIEQILEVAGNLRVVNLEISRQEIVLSTVTGSNTATYAWRNGAIRAVESDTTYVGQAIFDARRINLSDIADLFRQAADQVDSDKNQRLQVVDFNNGRIYMAVTTNPETRPVFFATDATAVPSYDPADLASLGPVITSLLVSVTAIDQLTIDAKGTIQLDQPIDDQQCWRTTRSIELPARRQLAAISREYRAFPGSAINATILKQRLLQATNLLGKPLADGYALRVYLPQSSPSARPIIEVTIDGQTVGLTTDGRITDR